MAYQANIPQPTDAFSKSQGDLLNNFIAIQTLIDVNHVDFANGTDQGKHFFVEFPVQSPVPVTAGGEVGLYSQTSTLTGVPELVFSKQSGTSVYEFTSAGYNTTGWFRLPSGILVFWGSDTGFGAGNVVTTFPVNSSTPTFANVFSVFLTPLSTGSLYSVSNTTTTITTHISQAMSFNYLVIGN